MKKLFFTLACLPALVFAVPDQTKDAAFTQTYCNAMLENYQWAAEDLYKSLDEISENSMPESVDLTVQKYIGLVSLDEQCFDDERKNLIQYVGRELFGMQYRAHLGEALDLVSQIFRGRIDCEKNYFRVLLEFEKAKTAARIFENISGELIDINGMDDLRNGLKKLCGIEDVEI